MRRGPAAARSPPPRFLELGFPPPPSEMVPESTVVRSSAAPAVSIPAKSGDLEFLPTPKLIAFLESSYRKSEYEQVARILSSREEHMKASLEKQEAASTELQSRCWTLEYDASFLRARCAELEDRLTNGMAGAFEIDKGLWEEKGRSALLEARIEELEHAMRVGAEENGQSALLMARIEELEHAVRIGAEEAEKHKRKCELLQEKLGRAQHELKLLEPEKQEAEERINDLLKLFWNEKHDWTNERIMLTGQNEAIRCELKRVQEKANEEADKHRSKCELLQEKLDHMQQDLKLLKPEKQKAEEQVKELLELFRDKDQEWNNERIMLIEQNQAIKCELRRVQEAADELRRRVDIMETQNLKLFQETLELRDKVESLEEGKDSKEGITFFQETLEVREKVGSLEEGKDRKGGMTGSIIHIGDSDDEKDVGARKGCEVIWLNGYNDIKVEENGYSSQVNDISNLKRRRRYISLTDTSSSS